MFLIPLGFHHNVINVNLNNLADDLMENIVHGSLVCCSSVLQPKSHDNPLEQTDMPWTSECSFMNIFLSHEYLIISSISIHETDHLMPCSSIHQHIGNWHWITIHRRSFVEISEIDAHTQLPVFLIYRNHIGYPFSISALPDEFCFYQLYNLGLYV